MSPRFAILEFGSVRPVGPKVDVRVHVDCAAERRAYAVRLVCEPNSGLVLGAVVEGWWQDDQQERSPTGSPTERALQALCEDWPELSDAVVDACDEEARAEDHDAGCDCAACRRHRAEARRLEFAAMASVQRERLGWVGLAMEEEE